MKKSNNLKVGYAVKYSALFLKNIGMPTTNALWFAHGTITAKRQVILGTDLCTVAWNDGTVSNVLASNLALKNTTTCFD